MNIKYKLVIEYANDEPWDEITTYFDTYQKAYRAYWDQLRTDDFVSLKLVEIKEEVINYHIKTGEKQ